MGSHDRKKGRRKSARVPRKAADDAINVNGHEKNRDRSHSVDAGERREKNTKSDKHRPRKSRRRHDHKHHGHKDAESSSSKSKHRQARKKHTSRKHGHHQENEKTEAPKNTAEKKEPPKASSKAHEEKGKSKVPKNGKKSTEAEKKKETPTKKSTAKKSQEAETKKKSSSNLTETKSAPQTATTPSAAAHHPKLEHSSPSLASSMLSLTGRRQTVSSGSKRVLVLEDYRPSDTTELSVSAGDILEFVRRKGEWIQAVLDGQSGLVPLEIVQELPDKNGKLRGFLQKGHLFGRKKKHAKASHHFSPKVAKAEESEKKSVITGPTDAQHLGHLAFNEESQGFEARGLPPQLQEVFQKLSELLSDLGMKAITKQEGVYLLKAAATYMAEQAATTGTDTTPASAATTEASPATSRKIKKKGKGKSDQSFASGLADAAGAMTGAVQSKLENMIQSLEERNAEQRERFRKELDTKDGLLNGAKEMFLTEKQKKEALEKKLNHVQNELEESQQAIEELHKTVDGMESQNTKLRREAEELRKTLRHQQEELEKHRKLEREAAEQVEELESQLAELRLSKVSAGGKSTSKSGEGAAESGDQTDNVLSDEVQSQLQAIREQNEKRLERMRAKFKAELKERKQLAKQREALEKKLHDKVESERKLKRDLQKRSREASSSKRYKKKLSQALKEAELAAKARDNAESSLSKREDVLKRLRDELEESENARKRLLTRLEIAGGAIPEDDPAAEKAIESQEDGETSRDITGGDDAKHKKDSIGGSGGGGAPPPPPPGTAPDLSAPPTAPVKKGEKSAKSVAALQAQARPGPARADLMASIRSGAVLKHVEPEKVDKTKDILEEESLLGTLARALIARRQDLVEEGDGADGDDNNDDDWD